MNPLYPDIKRKPGRFRVGDRVRLTRGWVDAEAEIIEDHGPLGVNGRRFYTIFIKMPLAEDILIDYPEDEMEPIASSD